MKIQVRQGVFETNSSTQHTLCIVKCDDKHIQSLEFRASLPKKIIAPDITNLTKYEDFAYEIPHINNLTLEEKVNILILALLGTNSIENFLEGMLTIQDILKEFDVELMINFRALYDIGGSYWWQDGIYRLIDEEFSNEYIKDFLFSTDAGYASYCDECCSEPDEEYQDLMDHMRGLLKTGTPEEDILVFHNRC